jgi:N-acetylmuramoyl-L-alanine amidase
MAVKVISSPNWSPRANSCASVWGAVIHWTATGKDVSAEDVARYFKNPASAVSAHDVIDRDGTVVQCVDLAHAAWHAGRCRRYDWDRDGVLEDWEQYANAVTVGFELCHLGPSEKRWPDAQIKALAGRIRRVDRLCPNFKLRNVTDHQWLNLNGKVDVNADFPAAKLFWWLLHPRTAPPRNVYAALPAWARKQVDEIKR